MYTDIDISLWNPEAVWYVRMYNGLQGQGGRIYIFDGTIVHSTIVLFFLLTKRGEDCMCYLLILHF